MPRGKDALASAPTKGVSKVPCLKCKVLISTGMSCIKCGSLCHPSCAKRIKGLKIINENETNCCDVHGNADQVEEMETDFEDSEEDKNGSSDEENCSDEDCNNESTYPKLKEMIEAITQPILKEIVQLRQEMNILKETNIQLIHLLTSNNGNQQNSAQYSLLSARRNSLAWNKSPENAEDFNLNKAKRRSGKIIDVEKKPDMDGNSNKQSSSKTVHTTDKKNSKQTTSKFEEIPVVNKEQHGDRNQISDHVQSHNLNDENQGNWEQQRKKQFRRKKITILGTGSRQGEDEIQCFEAGKTKRAWFFLGNVKEEDDIDKKVLQHIKNKLNNTEDTEVFVEQLNTKGKHLSFKIAVNFNNKDKLYDSAFWPKGVIIRRFNFLGKKEVAREIDQETMASTVPTKQ